MEPLTARTFSPWWGTCFPQLPKVSLNMAVLLALCISQMDLACAPATKHYLPFIILNFYIYISLNSLL